MTFKPFSAYEQIRLERKMKPEQERELSERLDQLIQDRDDITEEWIEGYISYDQAVEQSQMVSQEIREIINRLPK